MLRAYSAPLVWKGVTDPKKVRGGQCPPGSDSPANAFAKFIRIYEKNSGKSNMNCYFSSGTPCFFTSSLRNPNKRLNSIWFLAIEHIFHCIKVNQLLIIRFYFFHLNKQGHLDYEHSYFEYVRKKFIRI